MKSELSKFKWKPETRFPEPPEGIVVHAMVDKLQDMSASEFLNKVLGYSVHAFIHRDGFTEHGQFITRIAHHAGISSHPVMGKWLNGNTLGVEVLFPHELIEDAEDPYLAFLKGIDRPWTTDEQIDSLVELCRYWMKQYPTIKLENVVRHKDVSGPHVRKRDPKMDPGEGFPWKEFKRKLEQRLKE